MHILIFKYKYDLFVYLLLFIFCIFYKNNHMQDKSKICENTNRHLFTQNDKYIKSKIFHEKSMISLITPAVSTSSNITLTEQ